MPTARGKSGSRGAVWVAAFLLASAAGAGRADPPDAVAEEADRAAAIGDLFAWMSSDARHLNLAMTLAARGFSDRLQYVFHVDSGALPGEAGASTAVICRFDAARTAECWAGDDDYARGDASKPAGLVGRGRRFRVFAGRRDGPPSDRRNETLSALGVASAALRAGVALDAARCPIFDEATSRAILDRWRRAPDGGQATNPLAEPTVATLVVTVDLDVVDRGGKFLAIWAATYRP